MRISSMNRDEATRRMHEAGGEIYWAKVARRHPGPHWGRRPARRVAQLASQARRLKRALRWLPLERNERGNEVERQFVGQAEDLVHGKLLSSGYEIFFTVQCTTYLVHRQDRIVVTLCEGDRTTVRCRTDAALEAELADILAFHGSRP